MGIKFGCLKDEYPYGDYLNCPKCLYSYHKVKFCSGYSSCKCNLVKTNEDHLEGTCTQCGFTWAIRTADRRENEN